MHTPQSWHLMHAVYITNALFPLSFAFSDLILRPKSSCLQDLPFHTTIFRIQVVMLWKIAELGAAGASEVSPPLLVDNIILLWDSNALFVRPVSVVHYHVRMREGIGLVCRSVICHLSSVVCCLSAQKSPDLDISVLTTTRQSKSAKNLLYLFRIAQQGSQALQIVRFVGHAYQPHLPIAVCMFSAHAQKNWSGIGR